MTHNEKLEAMFEHIKKMFDEQAEDYEGLAINCSDILYQEYYKGQKQGFIKAVRLIDDYFSRLKN